MIKHIVLFQLKDKKDVEATKNMLLSMKGRVSSILDIEVGIDFLQSERSYDVALIVLLKDKKALDIYQNDSYHKDIVKPYIHNVRVSSVSIDFEI